jgi:hypothetical protein
MIYMLQYCQPSANTDLDSKHLVCGSDMAHLCQPCSCIASVNKSVLTLHLTAKSSQPSLLRAHTVVVGPDIHPPRKAGIPGACEQISSSYSTSWSRSGQQSLDRANSLRSYETYNASNTWNGQEIIPIIQIPSCPSFCLACCLLLRMYARAQTSKTYC